MRRARDLRAKLQQSAISKIGSETERVVSNLTKDNELATLERLSPMEVESTEVDMSTRREAQLMDLPLQMAQSDPQPAKAEECVILPDGVEKVSSEQTSPTVQKNQSEGNEMDQSLQLAQPDPRPAQARPGVILLSEDEKVPILSLNQFKDSQVELTLGLESLERPQLDYEGTPSPEKR